MSVDYSKVRGYRNNNPLNIRKGAHWQGLAEKQTDPSFCQFISRAYGWRAALKLLKNYITGAVTGGRRYDTITAIISRWAPPSENATTKYIAFVSERTHIHYLEKVDWKERNRVCAICEAMAFVECGIQYDINEIYSAYDLL